MGPSSTILCNNNCCLIGTILLILLHSLAINVISSSKSDFGYGVPCEDDFTCHNFSLLLVCSLDSQECECVKKSAVFLDETIHQCQVVAGKSCYRPNPNQYEDYYYEREYITVPCVKYAICQVVNSLNPNNKVCQCTSEYYADESGLCVPRKDYQEPCEYSPNSVDSGTSLATVIGNTDQCDVNRYFVCNPEGVCGCQTGLEYNANQNTCYAPVGMNCTRNDPAIRQNSVIQGKHDVCPLFSECFKGICQCIPGFVPSSDNSCRLSWGKTCNSTNICSDYQFMCRNGTCQCKYPLHQIYDKESNDCLSLVPGPCTLDTEGESQAYSGPGGPMIRCAPNAECAPAQNPQVGQCRCESRYKQDKSGYCVKPYGYDCNFDSECQSFRTELVCVNGSCGCPDLLQVYDREREECLGLVGSRCEMVEVELVKYKATLADDDGLNFNGNGGGNGNGWIILDSENEFAHDNFTYNNGNENGTLATADYQKPDPDHGAANMKSRCVEGSECKPFGPLVQFGQVGECICLDDWEPDENWRCIKLFK